MCPLWAPEERRQNGAATQASGLVADLVPLTVITSILRSLSRSTKSNSVSEFHQLTNHRCHGARRPSERPSPRPDAPSSAAPRAGGGAASATRGCLHLSRRGGGARRACRGLRGCVSGRRVRAQQLRLRHLLVDQQHIRTQQHPVCTGTSAVLRARVAPRRCGRCRALRLRARRSRPTWARRAHWRPTHSRCSAGRRPTTSK